MRPGAAHLDLALAAQWHDMDRLTSVEPDPQREIERLRPCQDEARPQAFPCRMMRQQPGLDLETFATHAEIDVAEGTGARQQNSEARLAPAYPVRRDIPL